MNYKKALLPIMISIVLSGGLSGCSQDKSVEEYLNSAQVFLQQGKNAEAIIELKNVLRKNPKNVEARVLLGNIYLSSGNGASAEKELKKAYKFGSEEAGIDLLKAYKIQQKNEELLMLADKINSNDSNNQAIVEVYRALSQYRLGDDEGAERSINKAVELSADSVFSRLGSAYLASKKATNNDALSIVSNLVIDNPNFTEALLLQGQLYFSIQDYDSAISVFERYQELQPEDLTIKLMLANAYIKNEQFDIAETSIDLVLKQAPSHALSNQFKGVIRYQKEDYKNAYYYIEKAIQGGLTTPANKILVGISAFQLKNYEQAYYYLNSTEELLAENNPILKLLAISQLKLGYNIEANKTLHNLENLTEDDFPLYAAASAELIKKGQIEEVKKLQTRIDKMPLTNPIDIARHGILKLSIEDASGIANIEKALELESNMPEAKIALAQAYLDNNQLDKALLLARNWVKELPKDISAYNLLAIVKLKMTDKIGGEKALDKALQLNNANPLSLMYYAELDIENKQPLKAMEKMELLLDSKPHYLPALSTYYVAASSANKTTLAITKIKQSFESLPASIHHRLMYAKALISARQPKEVIDLLSEVDRSNHLPTLFWVALGDSLIVDKQVSEALKLYKQWTTQQPNKPMTWVKASITAEFNNDLEEALYLLTKGLKVLPNENKLVVLQTYFYIKNQQLGSAQSNINNMKLALKELAVVQGFQGQIWAESKQYKKAIPKLMLSYQAAPSSKNAGLIYFTLKAQNKKNTAEKFLAQHVTEQPNDYKMRNLLAGILMQKNDPKAYEHYVLLHEQNPSDFAILNNLAWADYQQKNYEKAYDFGMKALTLSPENPAILDTVGLILLKLGKREQGIQYLKAALEKQPNNKEIEKHYKDAL